MEVITKIQCRHPGCGCRPEPPFEPFCSVYCRNVVRDAARENAQTDPDGACACGHAGCDESLAQAASPTER